ncbi:roadblock/LC7 domain-containing protein [Streptomyces sp. NPDC050704]|uniref:roadblock/LC7 domain-containing protein n=1 Tax=Streptomyces sp. NPDC050704 TaxID=3157219 RepID=UPI00341520B4
MGTAPHDLEWLLTDFVQRAIGARRALVTSTDGLKVANHNLDGKGAADTLSAIASGLHSLALGAAMLLGESGGMRQVIVELDEGHLFVMAAGPGALLSVLAGDEADVGQVSYEMSLLVRQVPGYLSVASRPEPVAAGKPAQ